MFEMVSTSSTYVAVVRRQGVINPWLLENSGSPLKKKSRNRLKPSERAIIQGGAAAICSFFALATEPIVARH